MVSRAHATRNRERGLYPVAKIMGMGSGSNKFCLVLGRYTQLETNRISLLTFSKVPPVRQSNREPSEKLGATLAIKYPRSRHVLRPQCLHSVSSLPHHLSLFNIPNPLTSAAGPLLTLNGYHSTCICKLNLGI